jgi:hypothetical protein
LMVAEGFSLAASDGTVRVSTQRLPQIPTED